MLFVGVALINNGACHLLKVDKKSTAALNVIVGFLLTLINFVAIYKGDYYAAGTGLLFAFTHLFVAANNIFNLNLKPYGLYSLFVAINTIPCAMQAASDGMRRRSSGLHGEFSGLPVSSKERHKKTGQVRTISCDRRRHFDGMDSRFSPVGRQVVNRLFSIERQLENKAVLCGREKQ